MNAVAAQVTTPAPTRPRTPPLVKEAPISVYPSLARAIGVNEAIILQQLHFLLNTSKNKDNADHFFDGCWWVYNSYQEWVDDYFPWLAKSTIKRMFLQLEKRGFIVSKQSVKHKSDRRKWYTINYAQWDQFAPTIGSKRDGGWDQKETTMGSKEADGYTEISTEKNQSEISAEIQSSNHPLPVAAADASESQAGEDRYPANADHESVTKSDDDDDVIDWSLWMNFQAYENTHQVRWGRCPARIKRFLLRRTAYLGTETARAIIARCHPVQNAWGLLEKAFRDEVKPETMPHHPLPGSVAPSPIDTRVSGNGDPEPAWMVDEPVQETPEQRNWQTAYQQLELQLDRASFDTWLRGAKFRRVDGGMYVIESISDYSAQMCQHRLYPAIRRVLRDVTGQEVELRFEMAEVVLA